MLLERAGRALYLWMLYMHSEQRARRSVILVGSGFELQRPKVNRQFEENDVHNVGSNHVLLRRS